MSQSGLRIDVSIDIATRRPLVLAWIGPSQATLSPEQARTFGRQLIDAATEVETQGFLLDWMTRHVGPLSTEQATALAMQFRQYLAQQRGPGPDKSGPTPPSR